MACDCGYHAFCINNYRTCPRRSGLFSKATLEEKCTICVIIAFGAVMYVMYLVKSIGTVG